MMSRTRIAITVFTCLIWSAVACAAEYTATVSRVIDGDTLEITHGRTREHVRLAKIDAPEKNQPGGLAARDYLESLARGKRVRVEYSKVDRYFRKIGIVTVEANPSQSLNERMVRAGWAWHYKAYDHDAAYDQWEQEARERKAGVFAQPNPIEPWEWRRGVRDK